MKTPKQAILNFMATRPQTEAIIGYGSGINPQYGQEKRNPQIDLIVVVDNLKHWHKQNIKLNPKDYSFLGKLFFRVSPNKWLRSGGRIAYMTYIPFKGHEYKIGTIEKQDFLKDLNNWETFYMAGRMQKPILIAKADDEINKAIQHNREAGLEASKLLLDKGKYDEEYFYTILTGLSYIGDTRMGIAENPDKVLNIVKGRLDFFKEIYGKYLNIEKGKVVIDEKDTSKLPKNLQEYLKTYDNIGDGIREFLVKKNRSHSLAQTIKGLFTTGPIKSIKYVKEKLKRRKKK